jgi:serine/threonine protein phosphatase PrpC
MDDLEFRPKADGGLRVICKRWRRPDSGGLFVRSLETGAASRAFKMHPENGDTFVVRQWPGFGLVGVIDGLGHGQYAHRASLTARQYVEQHFDQPLASLFRGTGRACRATRGVVMALARFDQARREFQLASVGNIETRVIGGPARANQIIRRGIIGAGAPDPVVTTHPWTPEMIVIMHSDGLRTHWQWSEFQQIEAEPPSVIALELLRRLGKNEDDATALVVKHAKS